MSADSQGEPWAPPPWRTANSARQPRWGGDLLWGLGRSLSCCEAGARTCPPGCCEASGGTTAGSLQLTPPPPQAAPPTGACFRLSLLSQQLLTRTPRPPCAASWKALLRGLVSEFRPAPAVLPSTHQAHTAVRPPGSRSRAIEATAGRGLPLPPSSLTLGERLMGSD